MTGSDTINFTCQQIIDQMDRTWQRLPISRKFPEPLPLAATLSFYQGHNQETCNRFPSVFAAIQQSLTTFVGPIWLSARPGGGKTSCLRWLARQAAHRRLSDNTAPLPIYIDLGQVGQELPARDWTSLAAAQFARWKPIDYRPFAPLGDKQLFFLDGLDLLGDKLPPRLLLDQLLQAGIRCVIAGRRDEQVDQILDGWQCSVRVELNALSRLERETWLQSHATRAAQDKFFSIVASNPQIGTLLDLPLLFAMTASACMDSGDEAEFRTNDFSGRTGIFAGFVQYAIRRAQWAGRLDRLLSEANLVTLENVTLMSARNGWRDRFPKALLGDFVSAVGATNDQGWSLSLRVAIEAGLLEERTDDYLFLHQQFAEYLAARSLAREWSLPTEATFNAHVGNSLVDRELDAVCIHAIAVLERQPNGGPILDAVFHLLAATDLCDACETLAATGSTRVVSILTSILEKADDNPLEFLAIIESLAKLPHPKSAAALRKIAQEWQTRPQPIILAALDALAKFPLVEGQRLLAALATDETLPRWLRIRSLFCGAQVATEIAFHVASEALIDINETDEVRADACEVLANLDHPASVNTLALSSHLPHLSLALRLNIDASLLRARHPNSSHNRESLLSSESLEALNATIRISRVAAITIHSPVTPQQSAMKMPEELNRTQLASLISGLVAQLSAANQPKHEGQLALLRLCSNAPDAWKLVEEQPDLDRLPLSLLASCARSAKRRYFRPSTVLPISTPDPATRVSQTPPLTAESVITLFLYTQASQNDKITLELAVGFSHAIGSPFGKSRLAETEAWCRYRKQLSTAKGQRTVRGLDSDVSSAIDASDDE